MGYDPSELMFMGDDDGSGMMMRGHHPQDRQPKGAAGLFNKMFK
jgi:hypothetical protein